FALCLLPSSDFLRLPRQRLGNIEAFRFEPAALAAERQAVNDAGDEYDGGGGEVPQARAAEQPAQHGGQNDQPRIPEQHADDGENADGLITAPRAAAADAEFGGVGEMNREQIADERTGHNYCDEGAPQQINLARRQVAVKHERPQNDQAHLRGDHHPDGQVLAEQHAQPADRREQVLAEAAGVEGEERGEILEVDHEREQHHHHNPPDFTPRDLRIGQPLQPAQVLAPPEAALQAVLDRTEGEQRDHQNV